jgi:nitroreductase
MIRFDDAFRAQLHELLIWRRDARRFQSEPLPLGTLERLIDVACLALSVGEAARARNIELSIHRVASDAEIAAAVDMAQASGATALNVLAKAGV